jgi:hypothetical protein
MKADETKNTLLTGVVVIVALLIGYFLGISSNHGLGQTTAAVRTPDNSGPWLIGRKLTLDGIDWNKSQRTLVFALQAGCHFCSESGGFYQRLVQQRTHFGSTRLIAVLPQGSDDSKRYLDKLGFAADEIRQASLSEIGVRGTPTLLLVNERGIITDAWDGKLSPVRENNVIARLQIK